MSTPDASQYTQIKRMQTAITWQKNASPNKFRAPSPYQLPSYAGVGINGFPTNSLISNKFYVKPPPVFIPLIDSLVIQFYKDRPVGGPFTANSLAVTFNNTQGSGVRFRISKYGAAASQTTIAAGGPYAYNSSSSPFFIADGSNTVQFSLSPDNGVSWYYTPAIIITDDGLFTPTLTVSSTSPI